MDVFLYTMPNIYQHKGAFVPGEKLNTGWVKGDDNNSFSRINPGDILATNGVIQVIDEVLLPD